MTQRFVDWDYTAIAHHRLGEFLFQMNVPKSEEIHEFEVVAFNNGKVVDRAIFWDSLDGFHSATESMYGSMNLKPVQEDQVPEFYQF